VHVVFVLCLHYVCGVCVCVCVEKLAKSFFFLNFLLIIKLCEFEMVIYVYIKFSSDTGNNFFIPQTNDRLCGLVQSSRLQIQRSGFNSRGYQII
jgi:hypothetical protein